MITIHKPFDLPFTYPLERIGKLEEILFFDIETTGFSGSGVWSNGLPIPPNRKRNFFIPFFPF